jgi:hypothetical protein
MMAAGITQSIYRNSLQARHSGDLVTVETGLVADPASCEIGIASFPRLKRLGHVADHLTVLLGFGYEWGGVILPKTFCAC